jgi:hypothetical protein
LTKFALARLGPGELGAIPVSSTTAFQLELLW